MKKPPKIHFLKDGGYPVCGTNYKKAKFTKRFDEATCKTCRNTFPGQQDECRQHLQTAVNLGVYSRDEMIEILTTALDEREVRLVMEER